ncbi:RHS repeat-associated core domain-containing protein [Tumidithrix helvetica]|uniref:RHS repeat-associated core domain-containing protein n=1 Tax=Tumidithrix helvetica TaxID=3457545 RepID=UPI003CC57942
MDTKTSGGVLTRSVSYKYDIFDRRIEKTVDLDGAGAGTATTERYVYDRDHIMLVFVGSTLKERYLYGANLDQVLAVETTQVSWTLSDYLGTVRDLVSSAGVVQKHIKYDSFGNVTAQSAPLVKSRFGFTGREFDSETGLYYYRARYYDSAVGRFISEDPISFAGGDVNLYRYVGNSATNGTDPFGYTAITFVVPVVVIGGIFLVGGAIIYYSTRRNSGSTSDFGGAPELFNDVEGLGKRLGGFTNSAGIGFPGGMLTFPIPQESRPTIYISPSGRYSDPNAINRGRDFEDIGGICSVPQGFPIPQPLFPPFLTITNKEARDLADDLGYKETKDYPFNAKGKPVFKKGETYITPDIDQHNGGVWKKFNSKGKRVGTYNEDLTEKIGD